jgi:outer membrane protein assembly factor BamE (lipoprotein component of BamABCDE complex)
MDKASKRVKRPMPFLEDKGLHGGIQQTAASAQSCSNCAGKHASSRYSQSFHEMRASSPSKMKAGFEMNKHKFAYATNLIAICFFTACQSNAPQTTPPQPMAQNNLTHGSVQLKLQKGSTTQNDVIEAFGAPNITTIDGDGKEVWTYRRHATVTSGRGQNSYFNILVFGASSESGGGSSSTQSMTLVIKFGPDKKVTDFQSMATSF